MNNDLTYYHSSISWKLYLFHFLYILFWVEVFNITLVSYAPLLNETCWTFNGQIRPLPRQHFRMTRIKYAKNAGARPEPRRLGTCHMPHRDMCVPEPPGRLPITIRQSSDPNGWIEKFESMRAAPS